MDTGHEEALRQALLAFFDNEDAVLNQALENKLVEFIRSAAGRARKFETESNGYTLSAARATTAQDERAELYPNS